MEIEMYAASIHLPWDDDWTHVEFCFDSEAEAMWYLRMQYRNQFKDDGDFERHCEVDKLKRFTRGWFTKSFVPFYACFEKGVMTVFRQEFYVGMETDFVRVYVSEFVHCDPHYWVYFWADPDEEKAKVIAEGYLRGWLAAKGL